MPTPSTSTSRTWRLRGVVQDYLIVRARDSEESTQERIPSVYLEAGMERWASSLFTRRTIYELYEVVGGPVGLSLPPHPPHGLHEHIKRRLVEAFRDGELVAYAHGPVRRKWPGGGGESSQGGASTPLQVPLLPDRPEPAPVQKQKREQEQTERTWLAIELVDEDNTPQAGIRYRLTLPDGSTREGQLDDQGRAREEGLEPGMCVLVFPGLNDPSN